MRHIAATLAVVVALLFSAGSTWATSGDDVDEGARFEKYISKAENGDVDAQVTLGMMYGNGWYVAENKTEAFKWFLRAAEQGDVKSQMSVGWEYGSGELFPKDFVRAYMWFLVVDSQDDKRAKKALNFLQQHLTTEQISEAESLADEWTPTKEHH
jgi:TPR repeat protein